VLGLTNLDSQPGNERMIFNRIQVQPPAPEKLSDGTTYTPPVNTVHDKAVLRLTNKGTATLLIKALKFTGPWKIVGTAPTSIAAGKFADLTIQFVASTPPTYTYNETDGPYSPKLAGAYVGSLAITTNDSVNPVQTEQLAGWFQTHNENAEEPSLQSALNLIGNYKTNIAPAQSQTLPETTVAKTYGEEVKAAYWTAADPTKTVYVRQLASWHTQGKSQLLSWYSKGSTTAKALINANIYEGQSFFPHMAGSTTVTAQASFATGTGVFGFKVDSEWSDDKRNAQTGGGHHFRFYPIRDHNGAILANSYFMVMDYSTAGSENFDFQDAIYVVGNVKPAGN
jgi:hypothetical protein